jgi:hypothetical protein
VSGGHRILIVDGSIGSLASGVGRTIPARQANFARDRSTVGIGLRRGRSIRRVRVAIAAGTGALPGASVCIRGRWRRLAIGPGPLSVTANGQQRER